MDPLDTLDLALGPSTPYRVLAAGTALGGYGTLLTGPGRGGLEGSGDGPG